MADIKQKGINNEKKITYILQRDILVTLITRSRSSKTGKWLGMTVIEYLLHTLNITINGCQLRKKLYGEKTFQQQKRGILVNIIIYDELVKLYADHKVEMI